ncbi:hypothetical protein GCM10007315_13760 [Gemmobacter tilapiae]|uniref:L,D-TPase catalytic domain-containing protein n=2 Tax=Neogemmobacter tilapiae TaxID=875041 RepID=A0A918WJV9_9RHOB|nr:hypothetical protein GCM10007315_13760 [Gemmobacter tilapiae]
MLFGANLLDPRATKGAFQPDAQCAEPVLPSLLIRFAAVPLMLALAACAPAVKEPEGPPPPVPGYEAIQDGEFHINQVDPHYLPEHMRRQLVPWNGPQGAGSIVVDTHSRRLYYVMGDGTAMRYAIAVGREGLGFQGDGTIQRKQEWPSWTPTANMVRSRPDLYAAYAGGLPGGLMNPLGARALYLYRGGRDTMFRIHGTQENSSIGRATSAGCIRLFNQDIIDLFGRADYGTRVHVRSAAESLALEGPMIEDENGRMMPYSPEAAAAIEERRLAKAEAEREALLEGQPLPEATVVPGTAGMVETPTQPVSYFDRPMQ